MVLTAVSAKPLGGLGVLASFQVEGWELQKRPHRGFPLLRELELCSPAPGWYTCGPDGHGLDLKVIVKRGVVQFALVGAWLLTQWYV